jgi:ketosteroid isomerase-like protein
MQRPALVLTAMVAVFAPAQAAIASDRSDALAAIQRYIRASNGDSREAYAASCTEDTVIVDHVPPYVFHGPRACLDHWDAVGAFVEQNKMVVVDYARLGQPTLVDATGERAYVVTPWSSPATVAGKREIEKGIATFVLRRDVKEGWRLASVTWTSFGFSPGVGFRPKVR